MPTDDLIAGKLGALAHPARLAMVRMLVRAGPGGLPAGRLGEALNIPANALTFHLQKLTHVDLIGARRQGKYIIYSAGFDDLLALTDYLAGACCADTPEKCGPRCPSKSADVTRLPASRSRVEKIASHKEK